MQDPQGPAVAATAPLVVPYGELSVSLASLLVLLTSCTFGWLTFFHSAILSLVHQMRIPVWIEELIEVYKATAVVPLVATASQRMAVSGQALRHRKPPTGREPVTKLRVYRGVDRSQPYRAATCCLSRFRGQGMATVSTSQTCRLRRMTCIVAREHSFINLTAAIHVVPITLYGKT